MFYETSWKRKNIIKNKISLNQLNQIIATTVNAKLVLNNISILNFKQR